jgi:hypothetical protein
MGLSGIDEYRATGERQRFGELRRQLMHRQGLYLWKLHKMLTY